MFTTLLLFFRKPETLGTEMKNVACSRLGTMFRLDIQKVKEATKMSGFQKYLGGTAAWMNRLALRTSNSSVLVVVTYISE